MRCNIYHVFISPVKITFVRETSRCVGHKFKMLYVTKPDRLFLYSNWEWKLININKHCHVLLYKQTHVHLFKHIVLVCFDGLTLKEIYLFLKFFWFWFSHRLTLITSHAVLFQYYTGNLCCNILLHHNRSCSGALARVQCKPHPVMTPPDTTEAI